MKKRLASIFMAALMIVGICLGLTGCGANSGEEQSTSQENAGAGSEEIEASTDKHTFYAKDYRGMNLANAGYVSIGGDLRDSYGAANIKLVPVCVDGTYVDVSNQDALKEFTVIDQNVKPNTKISLVFDVDENGNEYDNLVSYSNIDEIVLLVKRVGSSDRKSFDIPMTAITPSPDAQTRYVKDYVGRNLASAGYISMAGDLRDEYGKGNVKLVPITSDGLFINVSDIGNMAEYYVVSQSVQPNTPIAFSFDEKYDNVVESQSVEQIELRVEKVEQQ